MPRQVAPEPAGQQWQITLTKPFSGSRKQHIEVIGDHKGSASVRRTNASDGNTTDEKVGEVPRGDVNELMELVSTLRGYPSSSSKDIYGADTKIEFNTDEIQWSNGDDDSAADTVKEIAAEEKDGFKRVADSIEALARQFAKQDSAV